MEQPIGLPIEIGTFYRTVRGKHVCIYCLTALLNTEGQIA